MISGCTGYVDISSSHLKDNKSDPWNKNEKDSKVSQYLNIDDGKKEHKKKNDKTSSKNSSTLSLHIAAYENAVGQNDSDYNGEITDKKSRESSFAKTLKHFKQLLTGHYDRNLQQEFPRQLGNDKTFKAEVMEFKSSQKLLTFERPEFTARNS
uniref:Lipoprotein n=1 Tax=Panagrolaimus sp. ES5 TaxID=591445 RepID=A0AC34G307_9BILA